MQVISGTIQNAVKLESLQSVLEQNRKMTGLIKQKKSQAEMTPEERMLEQFKEQMANDREQSKNNSIATKVMNGETLTPDEEQYLTIKNPGLLNDYRHMKEEQKAEEEELRKCKTKDEVQEYKLQKMGEFLSELKSVHGDAQAAKAMEVLQKVNTFLKAEKNFIESGGYDSLPTEADEAIDRAEDRKEKQEEVLEILDEVVENEEVALNSDTKPGFKSETVDSESKVFKSTFEDGEKKFIKKKEKNPLEEIEDICKKYFSAVDISADGSGKNNSKSARVDFSEHKIDIL